MSYTKQLEEKYIPDMTSWSTLTSAPFKFSTILRVADTLYSYGGAEISSGLYNGKIWTASYNNYAGWTYSTQFSGLLGLSLAGAPFTTCIINSNIYYYGSTVSVAPVSNPLSWSSTGVTLPRTTVVHGFAVTPNYMGMFNGYDGARVTTASVSSPLVFTTPAVVSGGSENAACYLDNETVVLVSGASNLTFFDNKISNMAHFNTTTANFSIGQCPAIFHVGDKLYIVGTGGTKDIYYTFVDNMTQWYKLSNVLPANSNYILGSFWIGPDGYAYIVNSTGAVFRSGREKIYIKDRIDKGNKYSHLDAVTASGKPTKYTIHCQMGMAPWFTNRRDIF